MDLNELKALEKKIETLEGEKQALIDKQRMVVVLHKYFNGTIKPGKITTRGHIRINGIHGIISDTDIMFGRPASRYSSPTPFERSMTIAQAIEEGFIDVELKEDASRVSKDYINLDDIKVMLTETISQEFKDEVDRLTTKKNQLTIALEDASTDNNLQIERLKKDHLRKIESLNETKDLLVASMQKAFDDSKNQLELEIAKLRQEYEDLKTDKKRISQEKEIEKLSAQITALQNRGFWARLLNK